MIHAKNIYIKEKEKRTKHTKYQDSTP